MKIYSPFIPVRVKTNNFLHTVDVIGRTYTFGADGMIQSVVAAGEELLNSPVRIVSVEDGEKPVFDRNYPDNESASFVQSRSDEKAVISGCMQTERFIYDITSSVEYDGNIDISLRVSTRGRTVAQEFGLNKMKPLRYILDKLWLEIPLRKKAVSFYHIWPNEYFPESSGNNTPGISPSGLIPDKGFAVGFKPILWLGNETRGFGWFSESDRGWQCEDSSRAIELYETENEYVLRIHLLDSYPKSWKANSEDGAYSYFPLEFDFGFQATPVKPFPKNPYIHKALHIDCGIKVKGDYADFFAANNRYDRLSEKGVDMLFLHEKWNKSQNSFDISEFTAYQLRKIVDECHARGIKVITYFGYEISTINPDWRHLSEATAVKNADGGLEGGWWRVPFQRAYKACYNSDYADKMVCGVSRMMDEFQTDGIYLDSTPYPWLCHNINHGCGYYDENGELHGIYPIKAVRNLFKRLYAEVKKRGGHINIHSSGLLNFTMLAFADQNWVGENLQLPLMNGNKECINTDYFRAEFTGRNMGIPVEFLAYENRPVWNFEEALSCALVHGILPRPNDIEYPLELMSEVWKIFDLFPVGKAVWNPYWANKVKTTNENVKVSYYEYTDPAGKERLLAFVANVSEKKINDVRVDFGKEYSEITDLTEKSECGLCFDIEGYGYKIIYLS